MSSSPILVSGAGIVGMATVVALARAGIKSTLIAPRPAADPARAAPARVDAVYHPRVYAISPASQRFLDELGVWAMLDHARIAPVTAMEIHGDAGARLHLDAWQAATPHLAWIVESSQLEKALSQALAWSGVNWIDDTVAAWKTGQVTTSRGQVLPCSLCVGADGARSPLRKLAGLAHQAKPYGDVGLVAHLDIERAHQGTACQWFDGVGVLAMLPLPDTTRGHQASMVWSVPASRAQDVQSLLPEAQAARLPAMLQRVMGDRLGRISLNSPVHGFPLSLEQTDPVAPGLVLVGDAAHRVHPLAGQGLNLGLGDVQALTRILVEREPFRSPGDLALLRRYRRRRAEPVAAMRAVTDGLHQLFTLRPAPAVWLRNTGMKLVDAVPAIKRLLVGQASGF